MDYKTSSITDEIRFCIKATLSLLLLLQSPVFFVSAQIIDTATTTVTITAVVVDPNAPVTPPSSGGGGGGGGGGVSLSTGVDSVIFKGMAYPGSIVTLIRNGSIAAEVPASPDGTFEVRLQNLPPGTYSFGVRAEDSQHLRSTLDIYTVLIGSGVTTVVDGLFLPPTVSTDKVEVKQGDPITLFGKAAPNAKLTLSIHSAVELVKKTTANSSGGWLYKLDSSELEIGEHEGKARAATQSDLSLYSDTIGFTVGTTNRARSGISSSANRCDLNTDNRVNILDFSIMAFWYKRTGFPAKIDLNSDSRVDLLDLSILAYCWTG